MNSIYNLLTDIGTAVWHALPLTQPAESPEIVEQRRIWREEQENQIEEATQKAFRKVVEVYCHFKLTILAIEASSSSGERVTVEDLKPIEDEEKEKLWNACRESDIPTIKEQLNKGIDPLFVHISKSPFIAACISGSLEAVKLLIPYFKEEINQPDKFANTPLIYAFLSGKEDLIQFLIEQGADVAFTKKNGTNAYTAAIEGEHLSLLEQYYEQFKETQCNKDPMIFFALSNNKIKSFAFLLSKESNIYLEHKSGNHLLHWAAIHQTKEAAELILDRCHETNFVNAKNTVGNTALHICFGDKQRYDKELVDLLISNGADVLVTNKNGKNCVELACENGQLDFVRTHLDKIPDNDPMLNDMLASIRREAESQAKDLVIKLVEKGADVNYSKSYETILHAACSKGNFETIAFLIKQGADANIKNCASQIPLESLLDCLSQELITNQVSFAKFLDTLSMLLKGTNKELIQKRDIFNIFKNKQYLFEILEKNSGQGLQLTYNKTAWDNFKKMLSIIQEHTAVTT